MNDMTRVFERLYVGGLLDAERIVTSNPDGITSVFSLCSEGVFQKGSGLHYIRIPVNDSAPIYMNKLCMIMKAVADRIHHGPVLLHCVSGISRSPIFAAAWMHWCGYRRFDEALAELSLLRPIIDPSPILRRSVREHLR